MHPGTYQIVNGLCAIIGALLIWKLTENVWGWLALFIPGSGLVLFGLYCLLRSPP